MTGETPSERPPAGSEDPVASLFSSDRTLPAPVVAPEVNESELTRWKSARDSLFGDLVKDPPPAEPSVVGQRPSRTGRTLGGDHEPGDPLQEARPLAPGKAAGASKSREEGRGSDSGTPLVRALSVAKIGQQHEAGREPNRIAMSRAEEAAELAPSAGLPKLEAPSSSKKKTKLNAAPPPAAGVIPAPPPAARGAEPALKPEPSLKKSRPEGPPSPPVRTRKKTPPARRDVAEAEPTPRARLRRGPKPLLLAALSLLVLAAGGVSAVVLEIVPDPFAEPPPPVARGAGVATPAKPPALAAKPPAAAQPSIAAAPAAAGAKPGAKPATAVASTASAKPAAAGPTLAPTNRPATGGAPVVAAAAAKPALAAPAVAAADEDEPESAGTDQLVALARKALADENAAGAEAFARRALAKDGDDHHAMEVLARALIDQDRGAEAVTFARRIVEKRRKRVPYRLLLGDALLMVGDAAGARKEWQAAAAIEPNNREVKQRLQ